MLEIETGIKTGVKSEVGLFWRGGCGHFGLKKNKLLEVFLVFLKAYLLNTADKSTGTEEIFGVKLLL